MWTLFVALALARGPKAPPKAPAAAPDPVRNAAARWVDGDVVVQILDGAPTCDLAIGDEPRRLTLRPTEDARGWNLTGVEVHTADGVTGYWSPDGDHAVRGFDGGATGEVSLAFEPVEFQRDDGATEKLPGTLRAKWCGAPMGEALATLTDEGDIRVDLFATGVVHACSEGAYGDRSVLLRRFLDDEAGVGWGVESIVEAETGVADDFFVEGSAAHPVKGVGAAGARWDLTFAPVPPGPDGGRTSTLTGPLRPVWCGETAPPAIGADAPGAAGAWMGVAGRWFEVKGARWSGKEGLELSTLELTCDRSFNYMDEDVSMSMKIKGKKVDFWSVSGRSVAPPRSWNPGFGTTPPAPGLDAATVDFAGVTGVTVGLPYEVRGKANLVRCD